MALASLAAMLILPGILAVMDGARPADQAVGDPAAAVGDAAGEQAVRFWSSGGAWRSIVSFDRPCVVEWRLDQERRGVGTAVVPALAREYDAQLKNEHAAFLEALLGAFPDAVVEGDWTVVLNGMAVTASSEALDWMAARDGVARVEPDHAVEATLDVSVPLINADDMWGERDGDGETVTGKDVVVAVLDTGVDYSHPDLGGTGSRASDWSNVTSGTHDRIVLAKSFVTGVTDVWDGHSHGTHCAGIVGANGTVVGVAPDAELAVGKVLSDTGSGYDSWVIGGVEWATDPDDDGDTSDHCDVISMSLGGFGHPDDSMGMAVDASQDAGVLVAVAAGNSGYSPTVGTRYTSVLSPGNARKVLTVGSTSDNDLRASSSSCGPTPVMGIKPDVTAPGIGIYSTIPGGHDSKSGTSMATPHVAGAAALLIQSHPSWTSHEVKQALMGTTVDIGYNAYKRGSGRIDVAAANGTVALADPPSVSLGRLSSTANTTDFEVTFSNPGSGWANGTLSFKLRWTLTSLYEDSGNSTDVSSSMLSANKTSIDMPPGGSVKVKFTVDYDLYEHVGHYLGEVKLTVGSKAIRVPLAFYLRAAILLVDDDNTGTGSDAPYINWNPEDASFMWALDSSVRVGDAIVALGQQFDVIAPLTWYDGPTRAEMSNYRLVIWNCGFDYAPSGATLTSNDRNELQSYVDAGGKLWLMGSLILYDLYGTTNVTALPATDFVRATMGVGAYARHAGTPDPIKGVAGTFLAGSSYDVSTSFGGEDYGANATPTDGAFQVIAGDTTDLWGASWSNVTSALARDSGSNKTFMSAFEFGQIASQSDRAALVEDVIEWFDITPHGRIDVTGTLREGERLSLTGTVTDPRSSESYAFEWDMDHDGSSFTVDAMGQSVAHVYEDDGDYTLALRVRETRSGLVSPIVTKSLPVVNAIPEAHINTSSPGDEAAPMGFWGNVTDAGMHDTFTWEWDFDYDGVTFTTDSTDRNPTHTYLDDDTYTVALRVTDDDGGVSPINSTTVVVRNVPPNGNIFTPGSSNEGDLVPFTANANDPSPYDTVTVRWDFEHDGVTFRERATGLAVNHTYLDDGTYTVMARMTDEDAGIYNVSLQVVVRNLPPTGTISTNSPRNEGDAVRFNSSVTDPGVRDVLTFEWDFYYDGVTFRAMNYSANTTFRYFDDGEYPVALRVRDGDGGTLLLTGTVVMLNVPPKANITVGGSLLEGSPVKFTGKATDPGSDTFTYLWDFGDGTNSTLQSPEHTFQDDGTYNVTLRVTDDDGGVGTAHVLVTVANVAPTANVVFSPERIDENGTVSFQAEGSDPSPSDEAALTYTWNFGDGALSNERVTTHRYLDDGNYTVTMTVSDGDDVTVYRVYVIVDNLPPSIVASADRDHLLEGEAVNFTAVVTDRSPMDTFTVMWDFDDGTTSNETSPSHTFVQEGNYIVVLTVEDDDGGSNTTTFLVAVANVRPTVMATASALTIDEGASVTFDVQWTDPGVLDTFRLVWDFGDGANSTQATVAHEFPENGTYTVVVSVTDNGGGAGSAFFVIEVLNVAPSVQVTVSHTEIDEGGTVVFTAVGTDPGVLDGLTYRWDLGDGSPPRYEPSFPHTYLDNGAFRVVLVVEDDDGAKNTSSRTIIVRNVAPSVIASADRTRTTVGAQLFFNASATDVTSLDEISYSWNFGDGTSSTLATTSHVYQVTGTFEVTLLVRDDDGGQAVWNTTIVVLPDLDGDGIPDDEDDDRDGDGVKNSDDPYPDDPTKTKSWSSTYLMLLLVVVVVVAVVAYVLTRPRRRA